MKLNEFSAAQGLAQSAVMPDSEVTRARIMTSYGLDGLEDDAELAAIASFAAKLCDVPIALITLVEEDRQRFLVREGLEMRETPRDISFCAHAMLHETMMMVPDASADERFANNALVTGDPNIRFYAGQPLTSVENIPLGSLTVIDRKPRAGLTEFQREGMAVLGQAVMRRLAERRFSIQATRKLESSRNQLETVIDSIADIAFSARPDGEFEYFNRRWYEYTGESEGFTLDTTMQKVHPDDREEALSRWTEALQGTDPFETELRYLRADGAYRWMLVRVLPSVGTRGKAERWFGTMTDIDETRRQSEGNDLLARELSHRIKNIFAVVSSLIALRSRGKPEVKEFSEDLTQTIGALGRAHDYVRPMEGRKGDSLLGLLDDLLAPYRSGAEGQITVTGKDHPIGARAATPLALVFHELATNSAKYGALSTADGTVQVSIGADGAANDEPNDGRDKAPMGDDIIVIWRETTDVPPPPASSEGFGSRLVKASVEGQLGGSITREFSDNGLCVTLKVSAQAIAS